MRDTKQRKPKRRAHLDEYKIDASGRYQYTGAVYVCQTPPKKRKNCVLQLWICTILAVAAVIADGCIPAPAMMTAFGLLPYIGQIFSIGSVVWAMVRLGVSFDRLYAYVFEATVKALPLRSLAAAIVAALAVVCVVFYGFFLGWSVATGWTILSIVLKLVTVAAMLRLRKTITVLSYERL